MIDVRFTAETPERLEKKLRELSGKGTHKAVARALNRGIVAARKAGAMEIRKIYTAKSGFLKSRVKLVKANHGETQMRAYLRIDGPMENAAKYKAAVNRRGVFVTIKKGNRIKIPRGFFVNKWRGVFARIDKKRLPISGIYGPAVPQLFGNKQVMEVMRDTGLETYSKRLEHEIERIIDQS